MSAGFRDGHSGRLGLLQLLHLADSALPIGALAHSFGLETLIAENGLTVDGLRSFFAEWIASTGRIEAAFCLRAFRAADSESLQQLNEELSALKPARESRAASLRLGKRFTGLVGSLLHQPELNGAAEVHLAIAFGRAAVALGVAEPLDVAAAYLHQSLFGAISACQRLLPFGQAAAMEVLWSLKPQIISTVEEASEAEREEMWNLQPMLEIASMRHPHLETRLFIS